MAAWGKPQKRSTTRQTKVPTSAICLSSMIILGREGGFERVGRGDIVERVDICGRQ